MMKKLVSILSALILVGLILSGCGSSVERNIKKLEGTKDEREEAMMELVLAKQNAIPPLIEALGDEKRSSQVRADVAEVLFRMYVRESDERILPALLENLDDQDPKVRAKVATALGDIGKEEAIGPLLGRLEVEEDSEVKYQVLVALENLGGWETGGGNISGMGPHAQGGENMADEEKEKLIRILKDIWKSEGNEETRAKAEEFLENMAQQIVQEADKFALKADLKKAEEKYLEARELVEGSKNANYKLGKFYFNNGAEEKGLAILKDHGMVTYARRLTKAPIVDGDLDDGTWGEATRITQFYQCIFTMRALPTEGRSEAYLGYTDNSLYIAVRGYEESTEDLVVKAKTRDASVSRDDCAEIFFDTDLDYNTFYQILVNSIGTVEDYLHSRGSYGEEPRKWNGEYKIGTKVEDKFWVVEIEIPFRTLGGVKVRKGDIWGFNVSRVRIGVAEYGQWVPTYGSSLRPDRFGFLIFD